MAYQHSAPGKVLPSAAVHLPRTRSPSLPLTGSTASAEPANASAPPATAATLCFQGVGIVLSPTVSCGRYCPESSATASSAAEGRSTQKNDRTAAEELARRMDERPTRRRMGGNWQQDSAHIYVRVARIRSAREPRRSRGGHLGPAPDDLNFCNSRLRHHARVECSVETMMIVDTPRV